MDFQCVFWNGRTEKHQTSTARFRLAEENGQHRPFPSLACVLPHPLQNRVPRVQVLLPLPKKSGIALAVPDFFVSERKDLAARCARRPACGACRGGLQPGGLRPGPTEPAGETKSFCPCHLKFGLIPGFPGFKPFSLLYENHYYGIIAAKNARKTAKNRKIQHEIQHGLHTKTTRFYAGFGCPLSRRATCQ